MDGTLFAFSFRQGTASESFQQIKFPGGRAIDGLDDTLQAAGDAQIDAGTALYIGCVRDDHGVSI
jgi:hypothetical protein